MTYPEFHHIGFKIVTAYLLSGLMGSIYANSHTNSINNNNLIAKIQETNQSLKDINNTLEKLSKDKKI
jgi:hypothetical protein